MLFSLTGTIPLDVLDLRQTQFRIQSPYYRVRSQIEKSLEPGFLKFHVTAPHGDYHVEGLVPFKKLLHEIEVIETIKNSHEGNSVVGGAVDSVTGTGKGLFNWVVHPVNSVKGVGGATGRLGRSVGRTFRPNEEGEKAPFGERILGHWERQAANDLGVDVYTSNPYLKKILAEKARGRVSGKGMIMIGKVFIPGGIFVSAALAAGDINITADRIVNDESRAELFRMNQEALKQLGFSEEEAKQLLNNPFYTPRETTYLRFYLETLQSVRGYRAILKEASRAQTLWQARKILYTSQIAADSYKVRDPFLRLEYSPEGLAIEDRNRAILMTPYDYLDESLLGDRVVERALEVKKKWLKPSFEIWNGGQVTTGFSASASNRGAKTRNWLLF